MTTGILNNGEYCDARGRQPVDPCLFEQPGSLVLGVAGQSMLANFGNLSPYNPWTGGVYELCTQTGLIYQVTEGAYPTMGMDGWAGRLSVLPYWADMIIANGKAARVLLAAHCIGGSTAQRWCPVGDLYQRSIGTLNWLRGLGIPPNYWIEMQGQGEFNAGDATACTDAANYANLRRWKYQALQAAGLDATIVVGQGAHWTGFSDAQPARYAAIKQGQFQSVTGITNVALGPDDDEWPDAGYRIDGVHPADGMRYWQMQRWLPAFPKF